jgi:hypothetical protein
MRGLAAVVLGGLYFGRRRLQAAIVLFAIFSRVGSQDAHAASVRLYVLAPQPPASLGSVERHGVDTPWFEREFRIPYETIEPLIRDEIRQKADIFKSDTVECPTIFCPDVDWSVAVKSNFEFTQKGQPVITAFGDPQQNGVDIRLDAQVRLNLDIHVTADTTLTTEQKGDFPIMLLVGIHSSAKVNLWPVLKSEFNLEPFTIDAKNIDLSDLQGVGITTGAEVGFELGFTPVGLAFGGPVGLSALLAILGSEAADIAEDRINAEINKQLNVALRKLREQIQAQVQKRIDVGIAQANNLRDKLLNSPIAGIGKSYQDLSSALGLSLDVQTTTPGGNVDVIVSARFAANPGNGKLRGRLLLPKQACMYSSNPALGFFPIGFADVNKELATKVGTPCAAALQGSTFKISSFLGGNPAEVSSAATALPYWKPIGTMSFMGNLASGDAGQAGPLQESGYYECRFEVSGLPNADIVELAPSDQLLGQLTGYYAGRTRYFEVSVPGQEIVLDSDWQPVSTGSQTVVIGGPGKCMPGTAGPGYPVSWWELFKERFDPERCPQCGVMLRDRVLTVINPDPVLQDPAVKSIIDSLMRTQEANRSIVQTPTELHSTVRRNSGTPLNIPLQRGRLPQPGVRILEPGGSP